VLQQHEKSPTHTHITLEGKDVLQHIEKDLTVDMAKGRLLLEKAQTSLKH